jgi:hypothetical protein
MAMLQRHPKQESELKKITADSKTYPSAFNITKISCTFAAYL